MSDSDNSYIMVEQAAKLLGRSTHTVYRYGRQGRIRERETAGGKLFHRGDVEALAAELGIADQPRQPKAELVPVGEMLRHIQQLEAQLAQAMHEAGRLQGILEQQQQRLVGAAAERQRLLDIEAECDKLRKEVEQLTAIESERDRLREELERLAAVEAERDELREELDRLRHRPWWERLFGKPSW